MISRNRSISTAAARSIECTTSANSTVTCLYSAESAGRRDRRAALVTELGVRRQFGAARPTRQSRRRQSTATIPAGVHLSIVSPLISDVRHIAVLSDMKFCDFRMSSIETKLGPLLGLHFRNVLGDALCAERGLARRLSRVTRRCSRHRVRPELVHVLRVSSGATVHSGVGRGDDVARSADLLRPAGHGSLRSRHAGRAADLGAMGRQHHRGA